MSCKTVIIKHCPQKIFQIEIMFEVVGKRKVGGTAKIGSKGEDDEEDEEHKSNLTLSDQ